MFSPSYWLILLQNSSNAGEKREGNTRPVSQQVGERKHPAIMTTLMMIKAVTSRQSNGEERKQENIIVGSWTGEDRSLASSANCNRSISCGCCLHLAKTCRSSLCLYTLPLLHHLLSHYRISHMNNWATLPFNWFFRRCCSSSPQCLPSFPSVCPAVLACWCWRIRCSSAVPCIDDLFFLLML